MVRFWLCAALCLSNAVATLQNVVNVTVFYESLCPDSILFINEQLYPAWVTLTSGYLAVDFVPYGKASQQQSADGHWTFSCQHGRRECEGNKLQACALRALRNDSVKQIDFVHCVMSDRDPPSAGLKCAEILGISYDPIQECFSGQEGDALLAAMGDRTHAFRPNITFIPTVAFDGVYSEDDQSESLTYFLPVVCRHLEGEKPTVCHQNH